MKQGQQNVEHDRNTGQVGLYLNGQLFTKPFELADVSNQGQSHLQHHMLIPDALGTNLAVGGRITSVKTEISQHNADFIEQMDKRMNMFILHIHVRPIHSDYKFLVIEQLTQFDAYTPASLCLILCLQLPLAVSLP